MRYLRHRRRKRSRQFLKLQINKLGASWWTLDRVQHGWHLIGLKQTFLIRAFARYTMISVSTPQAARTWSRFLDRRCRASSFPASRTRSWRCRWRLRRSAASPPRRRPTSARSSSRRGRSTKRRSWNGVESHGAMKWAKKFAPSPFKERNGALKQTSVEARWMNTSPIIRRHQV